MRDARSPGVWTKQDVKFLKSLRISASEPSLRYCAVAGVDGWWHVIDLEDNRRRIRHFGPGETKPDPMQGACDAAGQLNRSNVTK